MKNRESRDGPLHVDWDLDGTSGSRSAGRRDSESSWKRAARNRSSWSSVHLDLVRQASPPLKRPEYPPDEAPGGCCSPISRRLKSLRSHSHSINRVRS